MEDINIRVRAPAFTQRSTFCRAYEKHTSTASCRILYAHSDLYGNLAFAAHANGAHDGPRGARHQRHRRRHWREGWREGEQGGGGGRQHAVSGHARTLLPVPNRAHGAHAQGARPGHHEEAARQGEPRARHRQVGHDHQAGARRLQDSGASGSASVAYSYYLRLDSDLPLLS